MTGKTAAWQRRIHEIVEVAPEGDRLSALFDRFIIALILGNTVALAVGTVEPISAAVEGRLPRFFFWIEAVSVSIFILEYLARLWACAADAEEKYRHPFWGRVKFALTPLLIIDLLAIMSFILLPFLGWDLVELRIIRLVARAARLGRYFSGMRTLGQVVADKRYELFTVLLVLGVMLVLASSLMYFAEHRAQPDKFASIPAALWWSIITLTTVGYGDVSPVTPWGQLIAGVIAVTGIGLFALPAGILSSGFLTEIQRRPGPGRRNCPHCGELIDDDAESG